MTEAVIIEAVRTPLGRHGGILKNVRPDDLAALVLAEVVKRAKVDPGLVEEVYLGCANQAGEDNRNVARMALLLAGLPKEVPGVTVNRLCGSGLDAIASAARSIRCGEADLIIAGGVESMSRAPYAMGKPESVFSRSMRASKARSSSVTGPSWRRISASSAGPSQPQSRRRMRRERRRGRRGSRRWRRRRVAIRRRRAAW